jgi:hypothetical protein
MNVDSGMVNYVDNVGIEFFKLICHCDAMSVNFELWKR